MRAKAHTSARGTVCLPGTVPIKTAISAHFYGLIGSLWSIFTAALPASTLRSSTATFTLLALIVPVVSASVSITHHLLQATCGSNHEQWFCLLGRASAAMRLLFRVTSSGSGVLSLIALQ